MKKLLLLLMLLISITLTGCEDKEEVIKEELPTTEEYRTITCHQNGGKSIVEYYYDRIERMGTDQNSMFWRNGVQSTSLIEGQEDALLEANPGMDFFEIYDKKLEDSVGDYEIACEIDIEVVDLREE